MVKFMENIKDFFTEKKWRVAIPLVAVGAVVAIAVTVGVCTVGRGTGKAEVCETESTEHEAVLVENTEAETEEAEEVIILAEFEDTEDEEDTESLVEETYDGEVADADDGQDSGSASASSSSGSSSSASTSSSSSSGSSSSSSGSSSSSSSSTHRATSITDPAIIAYADEKNLWEKGDDDQVIFWYEDEQRKQANIAANTAVTEPQWLLYDSNYRIISADNAAYLDNLMADWVDGKLTANELEEKTAQYLLVEVDCVRVIPWADGKQRYIEKPEYGLPSADMTFHDNNFVYKFDAEYTDAERDDYGNLIYYEWSFGIECYWD